MKEKTRKEDALQRLRAEDLVSEVNTIEGFTISPDGSNIAFTRQATDDSQIYISPINDFKSVKLTSGTGFKKSPLWSPDGKQIAYLQDKAGNECFDIYTVSPGNGLVRRLTNLPNTSFFGMNWSPDGRYLAFSSNWKGAFDVYTVRADGKELLRLTSGTERDVGPQWAPDGQSLLYVNYMPGSETAEIRIIRRDGSGMLSVWPEGTRCFAAGWAPDDNRITFNSNENGISIIGKADVNTGEITWSIEEENEVWNPDWSPDGKFIACLVDRDGNDQVAVINVETKELTFAGPENGLSSSPQFTPDGSALLFIHEGPQNPSDLWHLCLASGELRQLTKGLPDNVKQQKLVIPEEIYYPSFDGLKIPALLYKPDNTESDTLPPAVLRLHGGPNYRSFNKWDPTIQLFLSHGYVVLAPNFRGSSGYGEEFLKLSIGDWGGGDLKDVVAAADYLESTGQADGSRIALYGGSYGGYLMLMAMAKAPERWAAGVCMFGFTDLEAFYRSTLGWIQQWIETQIGAPEENPEFYRDRSPITWCSDITAPLLFLQGANDVRVPLNLSKLLMRKLEKHNKVCRLKIYEDEGHGFQKKDNQIDAMREALDFLSEYC